MKNTLIVPVEHLASETYPSVLCFPNPSEQETQSRIKELRSLGVTALEFSGKAILFGVALPVVGKGYVGIVVVGHMGERRVAVKIRRTDADRANLLHEAEMLSKANSARVGPELIAASKNFLVMQLIEGDLLSIWLKNRGEKVEVRKVLIDVLEQCWRLDEAGLDHGELSKAPKHLLVDKAKKPFIVDFETASAERRVANVTAVCQFLFAGNSDTSKTLGGILGERCTAKLVEALKGYKKDRSRSSFENLLKTCLT